MHLDKFATNVEFVNLIHPDVDYKRFYNKLLEIK